MKLRNKKTGEIAPALNVAVGGYDGKWYDSLAELNEEWEDAEDTNAISKEPLIKDEKIRKAVRAWAEANGFDSLCLGYDMVSEPKLKNHQMHFVDYICDREDEFGVHTVAELCGEEEE